MNSSSKTDTGGGASVGHDVNAGKDFVGRDQNVTNIYNYERQSDSIEGKQTVHINIEQGDIKAFKADIIAMKFANALYGADGVVADALGKSQSDLIHSFATAGNYQLFHSRGRLAAAMALFVKVGNLYEFDYAQIRKFAAETLSILADIAPQMAHLAMTIHGVGYGLDEVEALKSQIDGYFDAFDSGKYPPGLQKISIVEYHAQRAQLLQEVLIKILPYPEITLYRSDAAASTARPERTLEDQVAPSEKPHVFVAMPFSEEMSDIFYYGIQRPVSSAGYLCERVDSDIFTGDIFQRIKSRIETARFVIAEISQPNPNVFLELGYAWGRNRSTILLAQNPDKLPFDVRGQRCIIYNKIRELEENLAQELAGLTSPQQG